MDNKHGLNQTEMMNEAIEVMGSPIEFSSLGSISNGERRAIVDVLEKVLSAVDEPATHIRVRLEHDAKRNRVRPVTLRVVIDFRGGAVRGTVSAEHTREAIDLLEPKLRGQLRHRSERRKAAQHRNPEARPGAWRHGDIGLERPDYFPRPVDDRQVVRHKTVAPAASTVEEALFDLESMDYDFYLFIDMATDSDAFVLRSTDSQTVVRYLAGPADDSQEEVSGVKVDSRPAPTATLAEATERLNLSDAPCVFFRDAESGRGHVLYRRYDGHYGLIVPADEDD